MSEQLVHALRYGHAMQGPLKNLDTNEELQLGDSTEVFFVPEIAEDIAPASSTQSKETILRVLIEQYNLTTDSKQCALDEKYVKTLQERITRT
ncbi:hypothetical protein FRC07_012467 [Ceratobasidium sp. 392]|nr:hypothetical protein FRC07_012467 [Ceratobasidium sp. 392]